jgi:hypothetical protein
MKNNILKVVMLTLFLFVNISVFGQTNGGSNSSTTYGEFDNITLQSDGAGEEDLVQDGLPINSYTYFLGAVGILIGAYFFNKKQLAKA